MHRGVEDVARPRGVLTFVGSSDERPERERELAEAFSARGVDGLVIVPCAPDQSYLLRDRQAGTGIVFVDRPPRFMPGDAVRERQRRRRPRGGRAPDRPGSSPDRASSAIVCRCSPPTERLRGYHEALGAARHRARPELERTELADSAAGEQRRGSCSR